MIINLLVPRTWGDRAIATQFCAYIRGVFDFHRRWALIATPTLTVALNSLSCDYGYDYSYL